MFNIWSVLLIIHLCKFNVFRLYCTHMLLLCLPGCSLPCGFELKLKLHDLAIQESVPTTSRFEKLK